MRTAVVCFAVLFVAACSDASAPIDEAENASFLSAAEQDCEVDVDCADPPGVCRIAICAGGLCEPIDATDGTACIGSLGSCQAGYCKLTRPPIAWP